MLIASVISAIVSAILGAQPGGGATRTPAEAAQQVFTVMRSALDRNVEEEDRRAEAKRLVSEVEEQIREYHRSTLRLGREAFWRVDGAYASSADDYAPVIRRLDEAWVELFFRVAGQREAFAEILRPDEWAALNEEVGKWYAEQRPKMMEALDVDDVEDARTRAVAGAARRVTP